MGSLHDPGLGALQDAPFVAAFGVPAFAGVFNLAIRVAPVLF